jgi:hypothetical protein
MRKSVGQALTAGEKTQQKTVSDVFRHRSRTGKSYCRTMSDVGSERVNTGFCADQFMSVIQSSLSQCGEINVHQ